MTDEEKHVNRLKRREYYRASKSKKKLSFECENQEKHESPEHPSPRTCIPKKSENFANKIHHIIQNVTPRKKKALIRRGLVLSESSKVEKETNAKIVARVKRALNELKRQRSKEGRNRYRLLTRSIVGKYAVEHSIRKALDLKWEHWLKLSDMNGPHDIKRYDAFSSETVKNIERFYEYESVTLPTKRTVSSKTFQQKHILTETLQQAHRRFLVENPKLKISLSHFRKLRPKEVLTVKCQKFQSCLCEYCLNTEFKIEVINRAFRANGIDKKIEDKYHAVEESLCDRNGEFNNMKCIERKCDRCGSNTLKRYLQPLLDVEKESKIFKWNKWKLGNVPGKNDKTNKRQMLVEETGTLSDLTNAFILELDFLSKHLFVARWQHRKFKEITHDVPQNVVVTIADFSENYRCTHQDEIQSAYYSYTQVTVYPTIAYYTCPDCKNAVVKESVVFISPDLTHDAFAVDQFNKTMVKHLQSHVDFSKEVQFTDGCSAQFKSKRPFLHISETNQHTVEREFFGSRHGKSPCDALGGIVKKMAETHVKSRKGIIQNAKDLFEFCSSSLTMGENSKCEHKKRVFFYAEHIEREMSVPDIQTLKGTRKIHSIRGVEPGIVKSRKLTCFCDFCFKNEDGECPNQSYVGEWTLHSLLKGEKTQRSHEKKGSQMRRNKKRAELTHTEDRKDQKSVLKGKIKRKPSANSVKKNKGKRSNRISKCTTMSQLKKAAAESNFQSLPKFQSRTLSSTKKAVDKNSMSLIPDDIPLNCEERLFPVVIVGDGNCLPRAASLIAYGTESKHTEMRERIAKELLDNEESYLDNMNMRRGMNEDGNMNVTKTFASYSSILYMGKKLTEKAIKDIYEKELVSICKNGEYMGLWQLASLANIFSCRVVSICPNYGLKNVRSDMHRIFYPFADHECTEDIVYIMWTNINGKRVEANQFNVDHFVVMLPIKEKTSVPLSSNISINMDFSDSDGSDTWGDGILNDGIMSFIDDNDVLDPSNPTSKIPKMEDKLGPYHYQPLGHDTETLPNSMEIGDHLAEESVFEKSDDLEILQSTPIQLSSPTEGSVVKLYDNTSIDNQSSSSRDFVNEDEIVAEQEEELSDSPSAVLNQSTENHANEEAIDNQSSSSSSRDFINEDEIVAEQEELSDSPSAVLNQSTENHANEEAIDNQSISSRDFVNEDEIVAEQEEEPSDSASAVLNQSTENHANEEAIDNQSSSSSSRDFVNEDEIVAEQEEEPSDSPSAVLNQSTENHANEEAIDNQSSSSSSRDFVNEDEIVAEQEELSVSPSAVLNQSTENHANEEAIDNQSSSSGVFVYDLNIVAELDQEPSHLKSPTAVQDHISEERAGDEPINNQSSSNSGDSLNEEIVAEQQEELSDSLLSLSAVPDQSTNDHADNEAIYRTGTYIYIAHGKDMIPAVVDGWPYVRFFKKEKKGLWSDGDIVHSVIPSDVIKTLDVPELVPKGSRFYYRFFT